MDTPAVISHVEGLRREESKRLHECPLTHVALGQDFQARVRWEEGDVGIWDQVRRRGISCLLGYLILKAVVVISDPLCTPLLLIRKPLNAGILHASSLSQGFRYPRRMEEIRR